jgi:hypothetical protein
MFESASNCKVKNTLYIFMDLAAIVRPEAQIYENRTNKWFRNSSSGQLYP